MLSGNAPRPFQRTLLLDFDGVILKHKPVLQKIQHRVVDYVQKNVHSGYLSEKDAYRLNQDLYTRYGHTHLGMKKLFQPSTRLETFNAYVYDPVFLQSIYYEFLTHESLHIDLQEFKTWIREFEEKTGIPCYIFTNSPSHWCEMWLMPNGKEGKINTHIPGIRDIFGSNHSLFDTPSDVLLKPNPVLYRRMETYLNSKNQNDPHCHQLIFVDDSLANLEPIMKRSQWYPIWFGKNTSDKASHSSIVQLEQLSHLEHILV